MSLASATHEGNDGDNDDDSADETEGLDIEDMTVLCLPPGARPDTVQPSLPKKETTTENYTDADIAVVWGDRYALDFQACAELLQQRGFPRQHELLQSG